ncbi:MAG TPA: YceI family protein [Chryseolinea sp.]|nr:YceI family protein [Chryseolinea sp.]
MKKINTLAAALLVAGTSFAQTTWTLDKAHTRITFNVTHLAVSEVDGGFKDFEGTVVSKSDDFDGADVTFTAKTASIDTDNEKRDADLKSANFFEAEKYPELTFKGKLAKDAGKYKLKGDFTMHGVTKPVEFEVAYNGKMETGRGTKAGFKLTGKVNRKDYGLTWDHKTPGGELVVSDMVEIICKIEADKKA